MRKFDAKSARTIIVKFIKNYISGAGFNKLVIGLSVLSIVEGASLIQKSVEYDNR